MRVVKLQSNVKSAAKLLINLIVDKSDGFSEVARAALVQRQAVFNACKSGYVTLGTVYAISRALRIDPWALSYVKLYDVFGENSKNFPEVVAGVSLLSQEEKDKVLKIYRKK